MSESRKNEDELGRWMACAQDGDAHAYRLLLARVRELVIRYVRAKTGDDAVSDDIVQDVLLAVHAQRHTYDRALPFLPWLYAIAFYKTADQWRRKSRLREDFGESFDEIAASSSSAETRVLAREDLERLLEKLNPKQREVVALVKLEGLSSREAAERLGLTESDVKVTVHRALRRLEGDSDES